MSKIVCGAGEDVKMGRGKSAVVVGGWTPLCRETYADWYEIVVKPRLKRLVEPPREVTGRHSLRQLAAEEVKREYT